MMNKWRMMRQRFQITKEVFQKSKTSLAERQTKN